VAEQNKFVWEIKNYLIIIKMKKLFIFSIATLFAISAFAAKPKTLKLNLQQGQKFTHEVNINTKFGLKMTSLKAEFDFPIFLILNYKVMSENSSDTVVLKTVLNAFRVDFEIFGQKLKFDSDNITDSDDKFSGILKDMLHKPFEIHFDKYRNITNIVGLDSVFKKNANFNKDSISLENENELANFGGIGSIYDNYIIEEQEDAIYIYEVVENEEDNDTLTRYNKFEFISKLYDILNFVVFPENSIKKDLQWTKNISYDEKEEGKIDIEKRFKIKKITNKNTEIFRASECFIDLKNNKVEDVEFKSCTANGKIILDNNSCWINSANNTLNLSLEANVKEFGKMLITITINSVIVSK